VAEEHPLSLLQWRKKNSMCCCYPKEETQAPAVVVIVVVTMSFCRVWLVLVDISLRTRPKLI